LHVLDEISTNSGKSAVVMNYYSELDHKKFTFDFMLNKDVDAKTREYIEGNGSQIYLMPGLKAANLFKYLKDLKTFYKEHEYLIIHGHVANSAVFYLGLARKKIPFRIIHSHNTMASDVPWKRMRNFILTRFIKSVANRYIACSKEAASFLFGKKENVVIFPNAVDVNSYIFDQVKRDYIRAKLGIAEKLVIGHVGRFCPQKNHDFLIDVFHEVYAKNRETVLLLIGGGELYEVVVRKAERLGLKDAVRFIGISDRVADYMNAMDVFAMPSLFEGLPLAAVEAQASGLPVFLSENISRETDITGKTVFLPLEIPAWVDALITPRMNDRINSGNKVKQSRFNIETQVGQLCNYYEELLKIGL